MPYMINDDCICCYACAVKCPNDAILDNSNPFSIDATLCTECVGFYNEPQCIIVCAVCAIVPNPEIVETNQQLIEKYK